MTPIGLAARVTAMHFKLNVTISSIARVILSSAVTDGCSGTPSWKGWIMVVTVRVFIALNSPSFFEMKQGLCQSSLQWQGNFHDRRRARPVSRLPVWALSNRIAILPFEIKRYKANPYLKHHRCPAIDSGHQRLPVRAGR
jgi:uncharacterized small protein (DUF1192 family)